MDANMVKSLSRTKTTPIPVARSTRQVDVRVLTSLPAGKMVPITAFPLLREDRLRSSTMRISFELMETVEALMNAVNVSVKAYLVPHVAFERFSGFEVRRNRPAFLIRLPLIRAVKLIETRKAFECHMRNQICLNGHIDRIHESFDRFHEFERNEEHGC